ncbi:C39 family peptidase [Acidobacteriota bacterium]
MIIKKIALISIFLCLILIVLTTGHRSLHTSDLIQSPKNKLRENQYFSSLNFDELKSSESLTLLDLRAYQQTTPYTCGPCSVLTLMSYYGHKGDEMEIAEEMGTSKKKGTNPKQMVTWLKNNGYDVKWGEHGSVDKLKENLKKKIPTIVEWIDWGGHWVVCVGYDDRGTKNKRDDVIIFADPADSHDDNKDGITYFNATRFNYMWFDAFLFERPMNKVYITAVPKK